MKFVFTKFEEQETPTLGIVMDTADTMIVTLPHFWMGVPHRDFKPNDIFACSNAFLEEYPDIGESLFDLYEDVEDFLDEDVVKFKEADPDKLDELVGMWARAISKDTITRFFIESQLIPTLQDYCKLNPTLTSAYPNVCVETHMSQRRSMGMFYHGDYVDITSMVILSRFMMPIWGMMHAAFDPFDISVDALEHACYTMIEDHIPTSELVFSWRKIEAMTDFAIDAKFRMIDSSDVGKVRCDEILEEMGLDRNDARKLTLYDIFARTLPAFVPTPTSFVKHPNIVTRIHGSIDKLVARRLKEYRRVLY